MEHPGAAAPRVPVRGRGGAPADSPVRVRAHRRLAPQLVLLWMLASASGSFGEMSELIRAAGEGDVERVRVLVAAGADVDATDGDGNTALYYAVGSGRSESVRDLLRAGADPNAGPSSPLARAAEAGYLDSVRLLLDAGADVRAKTFTAIAGVGEWETDVVGIAASGSPHPEVIRLLVDRGALEASTNAANVRVRDRPTTEGSTVIGTLQKGDVVSVLGRGESEENIGDRWDYWLRVKLKDGTIGYSYGAFLDVRSMGKQQVPVFFALSGSRWGPPEPGFGFLLDLGADGTYRLRYGGEGAGQQSRGTWKSAGDVVTLEHHEATGKEYLPPWALEAGCRWTVQEDPENLFYRYRLTNTSGDSLWSETFPVQPGMRRRLQGTTVVAEGGREVLTLVDAALRDRPSAAGAAQTLELWTPAAGAVRRNYLPRGFPAQLLARTETAERVQGRSDAWYYLRVVVEDDAYGHEYLGWVHGSQLRK